MVLPENAGSVLDVGGGHGWYSATLCRRHAGLSATVLDLPGSARVGREVIEAAGLAHRVTFVEGDARTAEFPGGQDAVLFFNLLHHLTETEIPALFERAAKALKPGGTLAVLDAFAEPPRPGRPRRQRGRDAPGPVRPADVRARPCTPPRSSGPGCTAPVSARRGGCVPRGSPAWRFTRPGRVGERVTVR